VTSTKLVVRLIDGAGQLLGSAVHHAQIKGDGCLRAAGPVVIPVEQAGAPAWVSVHWCDVHVETRTPSPWTSSVRPGELIPVCDLGHPMMIVGPIPDRLPPITVGAVAIGMLAGGIGSRS
jgi:hypothetical protein